MSTSPGSARVDSSAISAGSPRPTPQPPHSHASAHRPSRCRTGPAEAARDRVRSSREFMHLLVNADCGPDGSHRVVLADGGQAEGGQYGARQSPCGLPPAARTPRLQPRGNGQATDSASQGQHREVARNQSTTTRTDVQTTVIGFRLGSTDAVTGRTAPSLPGTCSSRSGACRRTCCSSRCSSTRLHGQAGVTGRHAPPR